MGELCLIDSYEMVIDSYEMEMKLYMSILMFNVNLIHV